MMVFKEGKVKIKVASRYDREKISIFHISGDLYHPWY